MGKNKNECPQRVATYFVPISACKGPRHFLLCIISVIRPLDGWFSPYLGCMALITIYLRATISSILRRFVSVSHNMDIDTKPTPQVHSMGYTLSVDRRIFIITGV